MAELLLLISGGIGVGITLRLVCVLLGSTVRFIDSCIRAT
jgi:hypothetical protein